MNSLSPYEKGMLIHLHAYNEVQINLFDMLDDDARIALEHLQDLKLVKEVSSINGVITYKLTEHGMEYIKTVKPGVDNELVFPEL